MRAIALVVMALGLFGCAQPARMGIVEDPYSGLMWGSAVERNIVLDSSQLSNRSAKISVRNISGDVAYDMHGFKSSFANALKGKGYTPTDGDDFGIKIDVNVIYSGYIRTDLSSEFAFLGGMAGAVGGASLRHPARDALGGAVIGATLGSIIGSYVKDETYIVIAEVSIGVADQYRGTTKKTITFASSKELQEERPTSIRPFEQVLRTKIAVYAGGRNVPQPMVASGVRDRLFRIVSDII